MDDFSLTIGAHLLLWVFPLALTVLVIAEAVHDALTRKDGSS
jgi:hypothetical protein